MGNGLFTTLLTVRMHIEGSGALTIGIMTCAYYIGLVCASFRIERLIMRIGHIRAFAAFASALTVITLSHGVFVNAWFWILLRLATGVTLAGLYIVIESWLLVVGTTKTRGTIVGFYMMTFYGAQALGQFLINLGEPTSLLLFTIVAMLTALAIIPLTTTKVGTPQFGEPHILGIKKLFKKSASGVIGCFTGGLILSVIYGLLPLYISLNSQEVSEVALYMALTIFGGMALQYPIGKLSDFIDRRIVLTIIAILTALVSVLLILSLDTFWLRALFSFLFGGLTFTVHPVSLSHACDNLETHEIISGTQGLVLAYGLGAAVGPLIAPVFMQTLGPNGFFVYFIFVGITLASFFALRSIFVSRESPDESFVAAPQTTPITAELDPRGEES